MQLHSKGDDEDGGERAASREPGQLKTGGERFPNAHPFRAEAVKPAPNQGRGSDSHICNGQGVIVFREAA